MNGGYDPDGSIDNCEYRPVMCENCHAEVNARDEDNHKKNFCQLGRANILGLKDIKLRQEEMRNESLTSRAKQDELTKEQDEMEQKQNVSGESLVEIVNNPDLQSKILNKVLIRCDDVDTTTSPIQDKMKSEVTEVKRRHDHMYGNVKKMKVI